MVHRDVCAVKTRWKNIYREYRVHKRQMVQLMTGGPDFGTRDEAAVPMKHFMAEMDRNGFGRHYQHPTVAFMPPNHPANGAGADGHGVERGNNDSACM